MFMGFLKKFNLKFRKILSILGLSFVFLSFPVSALAYLGETAVNAILGLPRDTVNFVMGIFVYLAGLFAQVTGALLDWVTSPGFISLPYTKPGAFPEGNPIVASGLSITQSLVNLALVVILVFIAVSITLRLKEYGTQKTLVRLIAIALLVNFAPVFCGLIVDASNIAMNYFLVGIKEGVSGILTDISTEGLTGALTRPGTVTIFSLIAKGAIMIILNLSIGFAFLLLVFIFLFRYIAIWLLVILSPLAFVALILPATKKFWDMWWKQFLQWSFIGIPMAFFLYLAMSSMAGLRSYFQTKMTAPGLEPSVTGLLDNVFPYFVITAILYLGFVIGLQTSAMGADSAIKLAKWSGKKTKMAGWRGAKTIGAGVAGAARGAKEGEGIKGRISGVLKGAATFEGREKGRESMGKILERMHVARPGTYEESRRKRWKVEEETKKMEKLSTDRLHKITQRKIVRPADRVSSIAAFEVLAKRRSLKDEEAPLFPKMQSFGADISEALKARPDWAPLVGKNIGKQVAGTSTGDFTRNTQAEALKNIEVIVSLDVPKIQHIGHRGKTEQKTALRQSTAPHSATLGEIIDRLDQLAAKGTPEATKEGERLVDNVAEIYRNPNLQT